MPEIERLTGYIGAEMTGMDLRALDHGAALGGPDVDPSIGGRGAFQSGLYGCSEMVTEGLIHLLLKGVLTRVVYDDLEAQTALNRGLNPSGGTAGSTSARRVFIGRCATWRRTCATRSQ